MRALRRPPPPATLQAVQVPAPTGGLNTIEAGANMPAGDCLQLYNMVSGPYGLRARLGYRQFMATATLGLVSQEWRTLIPYKGSLADGSADRLFAVSDRAIYEVSSGASVGARSASFTTYAGYPQTGYGIAHAFTTSAGHFLLYCDELNGYYVYSETSDTWSKPTLGGGATQISGVDPANVCFVTVWKSRVWFVERNTSNVYYLAAGAIFGAATPLNLDRSAQLRQGGGVRGLWSWTLDGGIGIDDYLVAIGDGGDVAVYKGTDPASASTFSLNGTWNAGPLVAGRNVATNFGGDLLILTKAGIRPLSQLTAGQDGIGTYQTAKVANLFNALTLTRGDLPGWAVHLHPEDNTLMVLVPQYLHGPTEQLAQSLWNRSWSRFRDLPIACACSWNGKLYFGDVDGNIWINDGYVDGVTLAAPTTFSAVQWACLTPFNNGDGKQKKVELIRPTVLADAYPPTVSAAARYNLDLSELASVTEVAGTSGSLFDVGTWDASTFGSEPLPAQYVKGATGVGAYVAIAIRGTSRSRTILVGLEVFLKEGGYL
jgi:hypothetical protein